MCDIFLVDNYRVRLFFMFGEDEDYINVVIMLVSFCLFRFVGFYLLYKKNCFEGVVVKECFNLDLL